MLFWYLRSVQVYVETMQNVVSTKVLKILATDVYVMMDIVISPRLIIQRILLKHLNQRTTVLMLTNVVLKMEVVNTIVKIQKGLSGN